MRFIDLLRMCLVNLKRRKLRTSLTVLGVLIGTTSIVVMLSIGYGQKASIESTINSSRELTQINVRGNWYPGMSEDNKNKKLNDKAIDEIRALPHCESVAPVLNVYVMLKSGAYQADVSITGLPRSYLDSLDFKFEKGGFPELVPEGKMPLIIGNDVNRQFYNPKSSAGGGRWGPMMPGKNEDLAVDMYEKAVFIIYDTQAYWSSQGGGENASPPPKKYLIQADGVLSADMTGANMMFYPNAVTEIEALKAQLNRVFRGKAWPNQPATKSGRSTGEIVYESFYVKSDKMEATKELMESIRNLGYYADSAVEYIQQMQEQSRRTQLLLGGIGGISLFVAAIGIANTMMMAIYERTKEIGVFKVLGLEMGRIRDLFLLESAMIGLIGGILGAGLSYLLSYLINHFGNGGIMGSMGSMGGYGMEEQAAKISIIPIWLVGVSIVFGILIGMISGLIPALRAMRLSALEAIRSE